MVDAMQADSRQHELQSLKGLLDAAAAELAGVAQQPLREQDSRYHAAVAEQRQQHELSDQVEQDMAAAGSP